MWYPVQSRGREGGAIWGKGGGKMYTGKPKDCPGILVAIVLC